MDQLIFTLTVVGGYNRHRYLYRKFRVNLLSRHAAYLSRHNPQPQSGERYWELVNALGWSRWENLC